MSAYATTIAEIQQYENDIINDQDKINKKGCPRCKADPSYVKKHGTCPRQYILIIDKLSTVIQSLIARCKCTHCNRSFRDYPPFALPYKRYTSATVIAAAHAYVAEEPSTYESTATEISTVYDGGDQDGKSLAGSSIFRWASFLGSLVVTQEKATDLIITRDPNTTVFRQTLPIANRKYRSKKRFTLLKRCVKTIFVNMEFHRIFKRSLFPDFAITCGCG